MCRLSQFDKINKMDLFFCKRNKLNLCVVFVIDTITSIIIIVLLQVVEVVLQFQAKYNDYKLKRLIKIQSILYSKY